VLLTAGARLGPYAILGALGAGGMGEVYRARDTKLNRDVAIKILPDMFVADPERAARFEREAQLLAALNHPHIAQVFGLEEREGPDGRAISLIVLEFVDGESLARKLDAVGGSGLGVHESLRIARQIVDAIEAAHEKGIVHRDLKPANIMLTADGQVKVLDFGLARHDAGSPGSTASAGLSHSPTLTFAGTLAGMILGTATYMAPEQAKGRVADKRCDVWAFGCVLFEMLSGRRAFDGEDVTDVIAAIVRGEPDWSALAPDTPPHLRAIVKRCLEKDRTARIPDIAVVRFLMNETSTPAEPADLESRPPHRVATWRHVLPWAVAGAAMLVASALFLTQPVSGPRRTVRFQVPPGGDLPLTVDPFATDVAISLDGRRVAYVTGTTQFQLYVRELDRADAVPLGGIANVRGPFFSPDGDWIAYFQGADLKKMSVQGGSPITICADCSPGNRGGSWGADDTIVFAAQGGGLLRRVPAQGGEVSDLAAADRAKGEQALVFPEFVPGRNALMLTILSTGGNIEDSTVAALDLGTGARRLLARGGVHGRALGTHLVYGSAGTLHAVRFDPDRLAVSGNPVPVVQQVVTKSTGAADFGISRDGTLVYVRGTVQAPAMTLAWRDRQGREEGIPAPPRAYSHVRVSPDGQRVALDVRDQDNDIWMWDVAKQTLSRFTFNPGSDENAVWTPDGKRIAFSTTREGKTGVYWQAADGTGVAERLAAGPNPLYPWAFTPDGQSLVIRESDIKTGVDLAILRVDGRGSVTPLVQQSSNQTNADLSPDGKWIAYQSNESGRDEIYVRPFPSVDSGRWQLSTTGGTRPVWARNGRELFYLDATLRLVGVPVQTGATFASGNPTVLFELPSTPTATARTYDVAPDGRFLVIKFPQNDKSANAPTLNVVLNWTEELERLTPTPR
jgi:serine/threonine protein kinase/Tol biopolymer transport system component